MKDFVFKKKFGQNFIRDKNLLNAIVSDANISADDEVLEIGPGAGSLTQVLSEKAKRGESGIEPETSRTQSANHTTRPFTLSDFNEIGALLILAFALHGAPCSATSSRPLHRTLPLLQT